MKFINIQSKSEKSFAKVEKSIVDEFFGSAPPTYPIEIDICEEDNIADGLLSEAYNFDADLLIVIPENQTSIQNLFFKSVTKEIILQSKIPPLFFPFN